MPENQPSIRDAQSISSKLEDVCEHVRAMIESGQIKPGERVNEQGVAQQLGVGRNTAREALRLLERGGLVRIVPNRGAEVRRISLEEALDLYDIRSGLAHVAGRLAAARISPSEEKELTSLMGEMESALRERAGDHYSTLNTRFHHVLMLATQNEKLIELNDSVGRELHLYLKEGVYSVGQMQASHEEHAKLLEAIRNGRAEEAAAAFQQHILAGKQRMLNGIGRGSKL